MASRDDGLRKAWDLKRSPDHREHESGGSLEIIGALEHGAGLSRTAEIVIIDELRAFTADLLQEINDRMAAFGTKGRMITASSAGFQDQCKTSAELSKSDARQWFLVCPNCERESIAQWEAFKFDRPPLRYQMPCCKLALGNDGLAAAVGAGRWKVTKKASVPRTRGYHLDCFSGSAFETLETIHRAWVRANEHRRLTGSLAEIIQFQQGRRAPPYNPIANSGVTPDAIMATCRKDYDPAVMPAWASVLTVACDVQDNRLEAEVSAWGAIRVESEAEATEVRGWTDSQFKGIKWRGEYYRLRRAALSYHRIYGDPGTPDTWEQFAELAESTIPHASGPTI